MTTPEQDKRHAAAAFEQLTDKQRDALDLVADQLSSKEIAQRLEISPRAVDQRLDAARKVLGVATRYQAARLYRHFTSAGTTSERLTSEPFTVRDSASSLHSVGDGSSGVIFTFNDAGVVAGHAPWKDNRSGWLVPELRPEKLDWVARIKLILQGAIALAVLALIMLSMIDGLQRLI